METTIKKQVRNYRGATLELRPVTDADCGIVRDTAKAWMRTTGLWSDHWNPCEGETAKVVSGFRRAVIKKRALMAKRAAH